MKNDEELWAPVSGYEGMYSVSSHGRVRSEARTVIDSLGRPQRFAERILSPYPDTSGYHLVSLLNRCKRSRGAVHRLVARAFLADRPPGAQVDHIDGDRTNNRLINLRWVTPAENSQRQLPHATHRGKPVSSKFKGVSWHKKTSKWTAQIRVANKQTYLGEFASEDAAAAAYNAAALSAWGQYARLNAVSAEQHL
jgi:hypothetical protein